MVIGPDEGLAAKGLGMIRTDERDLVEAALGVLQLSKVLVAEVCGISLKDLVAGVPLVFVTWN